MRRTTLPLYVNFVKMSIECGTEIENLKYFCEAYIKTNAPIRVLSHLAKRGSVCYIITRKRNKQISLSSIPGSNIGAIKHGGRTAGPKYTGGQQPPCSSHIREYRETIKCCELEKMVPLARQCSEISRKRGNHDVRYQEFNEMTLDC